MLDMERNILVISHFVRTLFEGIAYPSYRCLAGVSASQVAVIIVVLFHAEIHSHRRNLSRGRCAEPVGNLGTEQFGREAETKRRDPYEKRAPLFGTRRISATWYWHPCFYQLF